MTEILVGLDLSTAWLKPGHPRQWGAAL